MPARLRFGPLSPARALPPLALPAELRTLLRGLGQILLQAHAGTGACVLAALTLASPALAAAALGGTAAANLAALLTGGATDTAEAERARLGLHGYSGALAALAPVALLADRSTAFALATLAALLAGALYRPVERRLTRLGGAAYSLPAVLTIGIWLPWVPPGALATGAGQAAGAGPWACASGAAFGALAQAGFASGALPGAIMLAGIALASPRAALLALAGGGAASLLLLAAGAPAPHCAAGLLGYNGALAALALRRCGVRAALGAALLAAALQWLALRAGLPPFSAPFAIAACGVTMRLHRARGKARATAIATAAAPPAPSMSPHSRRSVMPTFQIDLFEGRSVEQKRRFVEAITRATCETLGCEPSSVDIILRDVKKENWATAGKLWSDSE